jgi:hypothetical protein
MCYKRSRKSGQLFYAGRPRRAKLRNALQMTLRRIVYLSCLLRRTKNSTATGHHSAHTKVLHASWGSLK